MSFNIMYLMHEEKESTEEISARFERKIKEATTEARLIELANCWGMDGCGVWYRDIMNHPNCTKTVLETMLKRCSAEYSDRCWFSQLINEIKAAIKAA